MSGRRLALILTPTLASSHAHRSRGFDYSIAFFAAVVFGVLTILVGITGYKTHK
jgi:hypothetical protein